MRYGASDLLNHECVRRFLELKGVPTLRKYQRLVIEEVLRTLDSGGAVVAELPTGYGKTVVPFTLAAYLVSEGVVGRVIHTYPATSMIEYLAKKEGSEVKALREAWREFFNLPKGMAGPLIGLRHMFRHESPLLTNPYVITTLDTLVAHYAKTVFARAQKAVGRGVYSEFSAGVTHTSLLVFDEAHMYPVVSEEGGDVYCRPKSGDGRPATYALGKAFNTMAYIMGRHAEAGGVSLLMTATIPRPMLEGIKEILARYGVTPRVITYDGGCDDPPSADGSFLSYVRRRRYDLEIVSVGKDGEEDLAKSMARKIRELLNRHSRILCVLNTVGDAVRTYSLIKRECVEHGRKCRVVLMHSRYTKEDRRRLVDRLRKLTEVGEGGDSRLVIVATQVVEASVDVSVDALLTDAPPLDSLAQRVGRVCRAGHFSGECEGHVTVFRREDALSEEVTHYGPYDSSLVRESLEVLDRLARGDGMTFNEFTVAPREPISEAYSKAYSPILLPNNHLLDFLEQITIRTSPTLLEEWVYEEFGGFVRDEDLALAALVGEDAVREYLSTAGGREAGARPRTLEDEVANAVREGNVVKANAFVITPILEEVYGRGREEVRVPVAWVGLRGTHLSTISWRREGPGRGAGVPRALRNAVRMGAYVLIPRSTYDRELGLIPPALREARSGGGEG